MYNQGWHAVTEVTGAGNVAGDMQATRAWTAVLRMDDLPAGSPGPQIVLHGFGEYDDERDDSIIRVTLRVTYEKDGKSACLYDPDSRDRRYTPEDLDHGTVAGKAWLAVESYAAHADQAGTLDWNGEDPVNRKGGFVRR